MRHYAIPLLILASCSQTLWDANSTPTDLAGFQAQAQAQGLVLELPEYERTAAAVALSVTQVLAEADKELDAYAAQSMNAVNFDSSIAALDHITYPVSVVTSRMWLMKETQQDAAMRAACTEAVQRLSEWAVAVSYRVDLYEVCQVFDHMYRSEVVGKLDGEDLKLYEETMRDYRRAGMSLSKEVRDKVANLKNELNRLSTEFDTNITDAQVVLCFTKAELAGVSDDFLAASLQEDGQHHVRATTTPDYMMVMQNCSVGATRKALNSARYSTCKESNGPILNQLVAVRNEIADMLGYVSWADYQIEPKMAQTAIAATSFGEDLAARLQPKFDAEVHVLQSYKAEDVGDPTTKINWWDFRYYQNQMMKEEFGVDSDALRHYFSLEKVLVGMFDVYEHIFNLKFTAVDPGYSWVDDLRLHVVTDASTGKVMGAFYLDLFPREGKYNHFAQFDIIGGKRLADGRYQRPVVSLVCNFTPGVGDQPALMNHGEVETIFHEFGHAMHSILTEASYARYAGANVERDFVEAPSQMFEAWAWDPTVLSNFAKDWRDETKVLPRETIVAMEKAKAATTGIFYRRQLALALSDLRIHAGGVTDAKKVCNQTNTEILFKVPDGSHFAAYWGHLTGYDAGYYGYAWADSIAADLATVFENAPQGFLDQEAGMRLRREIYQVGGSRKGGDSVRAFLGRAPTNAAFVKNLGL